MNIKLNRKSRRRMVSKVGETPYGHRKGAAEIIDVSYNVNYFQGHISAFTGSGKRNQTSQK
jgi:hypothetical protein